MERDDKLKSGQDLLRKFKKKKRSKPDLHDQAAAQPPERVRSHNSSSDTLVDAANSLTQSDSNDPYRNIFDEYGAQSQPLPERLEEKTTHDAKHPPSPPASIKSSPISPATDCSSDSHQTAEKESVKLASTGPPAPPEHTTDHEECERRIATLTFETEQFKATIVALEQKCTCLKSDLNNRDQKLKAATAETQTLSAQQESAREAWAAQQRDWAEHVSNLMKQFSQKDDTIRELADKVKRMEEAASVKQNELRQATASTQSSSIDKEQHAATVKRLELRIGELETLVKKYEVKVAAGATEQAQNTKIVQQLEQSNEELTRLRLRIRSMEQSQPAPDVDYKTRFVESCVKITTLVKERRNLLLELNVARGRLENLEKFVTASAAVPSKLEAANRLDTDRLSQRIQQLTKIITHLTRINFEQDAAMRLRGRQ